ncbi:MAG TPA: TonB-dependent hemoglobin/transferrin/lactoferrin family receptor [Steroidobacteraceae bacterium]
MRDPDLTGLAVMIAATLAAAAAGSPAHAAVASLPEADLENITVYARRLTPVARVAATVTVLDQVQIERSLSADVKELVRYEPGLTVRNDPFRFGLDTFSVRGLGGNRVAVEIDGIPAAGGFAVGSYSDSGRSFIDLAFVDRIEFLRGPASSLYGSDAIGGIVAMSTLQPARLLDEGAGRYGVRTETGYANVDDGWHVAAIGAAAAGPGALLLGYVRREGNEPGTAANVDPDPRSYTSDSVLLKYRLDEVAGGPLTIAVEGGQVRQDTSVQAFLGVGRFAATTRLVGDDSVQRYRASVDQSLPASRWHDGLDWRVYLQGTETQQDTYETRRAVPPRTPPLQIDRQFSFDERTYGAEATVVDAVTAGHYKHDFVYGFEASRTRIDERRDGLQTNLTTGATTSTILGETLPVRDLPISDVTEIGLFAQDEFSPAGGRWTLVPALRVDYYDLNPRPDSIYEADNPSSTAVGLSDVSIAPKLGATYQFTDSLGAYVQYAHGFRSPPPEEVNIGLEIPLFNVRAIPNPDLKAEKSDGYEVGLRWRAPTVNVTASLYDNEYRDFIESKVNLGPDPATGVILFQSQNIARARIYGAELSVTLHGEALSAALDGWSGRLAAAWSRGTDLEQDAPLNSVDPASAVLGLRYDARSGRWGSELTLTAVEAKTEVDDTPIDLYQTGGYATLDWVANLDLGHGLSLNAGVFNLGNARYIEWADVRGRAANDPLVPYYTRPGRNASVTLHWAF